MTNIDLLFRLGLFLSVVGFHLITRNALEYLSDKISFFYYVWKVFRCLKCLNVQTQAYFTLYLAYIGVAVFNLWYFISLFVILVTAAYVSENISKFFQGRALDEIDEMMKEQEDKIEGMVDVTYRPKVKRNTVKSKIVKKN
jgi:glucan phosphoethanolaminetransferase (alkaline phosphatase superfamily)